MRIAPQYLQQEIVLGHERISIGVNKHFSVNQILVERNGVFFIIDLFSKFSQCHFRLAIVVHKEAL